MSYQYEILLEKDSNTPNYLSGRN